jgi:hypothetical protein
MKIYEELDGDEWSVSYSWLHFPLGGRLGEPKSHFFAEKNRNNHTFPLYNPQPLYCLSYVGSVDMVITEGS